MTKPIIKTAQTLLFTLLVVLLIGGGCSASSQATLQNSEDTVNRSLTSLVPAELVVSAAEIDETVSFRSNEAEPLGVFTTLFNPKNKSRSHNIKLAASAIHEVTVYPGEIFSYNETVGPTTKKNGYKRGTIFIKGEMFKGYGGGVCQVSSTLYNAAANAGMYITERHDHSLPVPYVETGKDAATSYGGIDFKFENTKPYPVIIHSHVADGMLTVTLSAV